MKKIVIYFIFFMLLSNFIFAFKTTNLRMVESFISEGKYDKAEKLLLDNIQKKDRYIESLILMGDIYFYKTKQETARQYYKKALKHSKNKIVNSHIYNKIADTYFEKKDQDKAIRVLKEAVIKEEYNVGTFIRLGLAYTNLDISEQVLENYKKAYELEPNNVFVNLKLAEINTKNLDYEEAIFYYKRIVELTNNSYFKYKLAELYYLKNELDVSLGIMLNIIDDAVIYEYNLLLGEIFYKQKKFDKALKEYEKAYFLNPEDKNVLINIYLTLLHLENIDSAKQVYKKLNLKDENLIIISKLIINR